MSRQVLVVQTGTANTASVLAGLRRTGADPVLVEDPSDLLKADRVVLPGVGALAAAMDRLEASGLTGVLKERIAEGRPTLAICLGLQLLCNGSEESPGTPGFGVVDGNIGAFSDRVNVPQMGWNQVIPAAGCRYLRDGHAYFANSYRLSEAPADWAVAWSDYGGRFVAALEQGDVLACQFHPELSGAWGADLLDRWCRGGAAC